MNFVRPLNSITGPVTDEEISDFVVLSGPNGSGKSNLLQAINDGAITIDGVPHPGSPSPSFRLFALSQLVAATDTAQMPAAYSDRWVQLHQQVEQNVAQLVNHPNNWPRGSDQVDAEVINRLVNTRQIGRVALDRMVREANKRLIDFTPDDFRIYSPTIIGVRDPFSLTVT